MAGEFISQRVDVTVGSLFLLVGFTLQLVDAAGYKLLPLGSVLGYGLLIVGSIGFFAGGRAWMIARLMSRLRGPS